jgi:hypothetical protein
LVAFVSVWTRPEAPSTEAADVRVAVSLGVIWLRELESLVCVPRPLAVVVGFEDVSSVDTLDPEASNSLTSVVVTEVEDAS